MNPSLNYDKRDPKFILLGKIFKDIDNDKSRDIYSRSHIKNREMMVKSLKIFFTSIFFDYTISDVINELNRSRKLRKFFNFRDEIPTSQQIYEYMNRVSPEQYNKITNDILKKFYKRKRSNIANYIVDATPVACDINTARRYVTDEQLKKLDLKWGYSTTKGHFIGFKVTMVLDKDTMTPISILIHPGAPNDTQLLDPVLKELKRRRLIKKITYIYFDRGYYSYSNYQIAINIYNIIPIIFPRSNFKESKLKGIMSYSLDIYKLNKHKNQSKKHIKNLLKLLFTKLANWHKYKPIRGIIEDFFKVAKDAFGLGQFHAYTTKSMSKNIYLTILLTALTVQKGYKTKTQIQQLAEGKINQNKPKNKNNNKKKIKKETKTKKPTPKKNKQQKIEITQKEKQTTLKKYN